MKIADDIRLTVINCARKRMRVFEIEQELFGITWGNECAANRVKTRRILNQLDRDGVIEFHRGFGGCKGYDGTAILPTGDRSREFEKRMPTKREK